MDETRNSIAFCTSTSCGASARETYHSMDSEVDSHVIVHRSSYGYGGLARRTSSQSIVDAGQVSVVHV